MIYDCLIVGGGQAGLSLAAQLKNHNRTALILERDARIGDVWRRRPDSMLLFTPRSISALPGLPLTGDPKGYPDKHEIADYLETYVEHHQLTVLTGHPVVSTAYADQRYTLTTASGEQFQGRCLVNATGANQVVNVPDCAQALNPTITQLTIDHYQNPAQIGAGKKVAIVGDGSSGRQIAKELAKTHHVTLFCGQARPFAPQAVFGVNILYLLKKLSILQADTHSAVGKMLIRKGLIPCNNITNKIMQQCGVKMVGQFSRIEDTQLLDDQQRVIEPDVVIWSLGYKEDTRWLTLPNAADKDGFLCQTGHKNGGRTPHPDLFVVGRKWLSCRASELIYGSAQDAARVAMFIKQRLAQRRIDG